MLTESIVAAVAHVLNGDPALAEDEGFEVDSAVIAGGRIKVELIMTDGNTQVSAVFALMEVSLPARIRKSEKAS